MHIAQNGPQDQTDRLLCCGGIGRALGLNRRCTLRLLQRSYLPGKEVWRGVGCEFTRASARPRRARRRASTTGRLSLQSVSCQRPQGPFGRRVQGRGAPPRGPLLEPERILGLKHASHFDQI
jgi:hypothetical protein